MVKRWNAMVPYVDDHIVNLRRGLAAGKIAVRAGVEKVIDEIKDLKAKPDTDWGLLRPLAVQHDDWPERERKGFHDGLTSAVRDFVRPALLHYSQFLQMEVLPKARPQDLPGIVHVQGGSESYRRLIRVHTSLDLSPDELHETGLREVSRINNEMEKLGEKIEELEEEVIRYSNKRNLARINQVRKELIVLKRNMAPVRDLINGFLRSDSALLEEATSKYFKDVYDHIVQANDLSENYRDMMITLQDLYLNNVNLKLNEVMKVMAIVTCLLAPAAVIGGIFGMNFDRIPYLHNQYGFYIAVGLMLLIPLWMIAAFKRRGWF